LGDFTEKRISRKDAKKGFDAKTLRKQRGNEGNKKRFVTYFSLLLFLISLLLCVKIFASLREN